MPSTSQCLNHFLIRGVCIEGQLHSEGVSYVKCSRYCLVMMRARAPAKACPQGGAAAGCGGWLLGPWPWPWQCRQPCGGGRVSVASAVQPRPRPGSGPRRDNAVLVAAWPRQPQHPPRLGVSNFDINTDNIVLTSIFALPKCTSKHIVSKPHWNWDTCPQNLLWSKCLIFVCETDCKFWCCLSVHCTCWKLKNYDLMVRWPDIQL